MTEPRGTEGAGGTERPDGRACPRCGTARAADRTPECGCAQDVSDALREARTAEAAAAEDFDPLRIRPYVELEGEGAPDDGETMALRAVPAPAAPAASALPTPLAPGASAPSAQDLSLFDPATATLRVVDRGGSGTAGGGRRRRTVLLGAGAAVVAVVAAAGLASGLFAYDAPSRDEAQPKDVRAGVPAPSASTSETTRAAGRHRRRPVGLRVGAGVRVPVDRPDGVVVPVPLRDRRVPRHRPPRPNRNRAPARPRAPPRRTATWRPTRSRPCCAGVPRARRSSNWNCA